MGYFEALIIYLAIGSPIGVYAIVRSKSSLKQDLIALLTANILFWPVFASLEFVPQTPSDVGPNYFIDGRPHSSSDERSRSNFISSLADLGDRAFRRKALEALERYTALSNAVPSTAAETAIPEIFDATDHPNSSVAAKCLFRKNRSKLIGHRDRSLDDLHALADQLTSEERAKYAAAIGTARTELLDSTIS